MRAATISMGGDGCAYWYITPGLSAGTHSITTSYSGDAKNAAGSSAPLSLTVSPVPVKLALICWNPTFSYGANYQCAITATSNAGSPAGSVTYTVDGGAATMVALSNGNATVTVPTPSRGHPHDNGLLRAAEQLRRIRDANTILHRDRGSGSCHNVAIDRRGDPRHERQLLRRGDIVERRHTRQRLIQLP